MSRIGLSDAFKMDPKVFSELKLTELCNHTYSYMNNAQSTQNAVTYEAHKPDPYEFCVKITFIAAGSNGCIYKCKPKKISYAIKIVPMTEELSLAELQIGEELKHLKNIHIKKQYLGFETNGIPKLRVIHDELYDFLHRRLYQKHALVLIQEWITGDTLHDFIISDGPILQIKEWRDILFQIIWVLCKIQEACPSYRHNDLSCSNILISKRLKGEVCYETNTNKTIKPKYILRDLEYHIFVCDFDLSCTKDITNPRLALINRFGLNDHSNKYYDLHYIFNTIINVTEKYNIELPSVVKNLIYTIVPVKYRGWSIPGVIDEGHLLAGELYTPEDALAMPFFNCLR